VNPRTRLKGKWMHKSIAGLNGSRRPAWAAVFVMALCLAAPALLAACVGEFRYAARSDEIRSHKEQAAPSADSADLAGLVDDNRPSRQSGRQTLRSLLTDFQTNPLLLPV